MTVVIKVSNFSILPIRFHCFLLFVCCPSFVPALTFHQRHKMFTDEKMEKNKLNYNLLAWYM